MYFYYFKIISTLRKAWPFIWTNLYPLLPRETFDKLDWNWPSGSGEENENVESLHENVESLHENVERWKDSQTDDEQQVITNTSIELSAQVT